MSNQTEQWEQVERARQAVRDQDYAAADALYAALVRAQPHDAALWREYGKAKVWADQEEEAAALFERALAEDPESIESLLWLADVCADGYGPGYAAALAVLRRVIALDPENVEAYIALGCLYG